MVVERTIDKGKGQNQRICQKCQKSTGSEKRMKIKGEISERRKKEGENGRRIVEEMEMSNGVGRRKNIILILKETEEKEKSQKRNGKSQRESYW